MQKTDDMATYARAYIDAALDIQKQLGQSPNISSDDYETAVKRAASVFENLAQVRSRPADQEPVVSN